MPERDNVVSREFSTRYLLDSLDFFLIQRKVEDVKVGTHVAGVGGAGQGQHAHVEGEPEDDLSDGPTAW